MSRRVDLERGEANGQGDDQLDSIENVIGSPWDDVLKGDGETNVLNGQQGNDTEAAGPTPPTSPRVRTTRSATPSPPSGP